MFDRGTIHPGKKLAFPKDVVGLEKTLNRVELRVGNFTFRIHIRRVLNSCPALGVREYQVLRRCEIKYVRRGVSEA